MFALCLHVSFNIDFRTPSRVEHCPDTESLLMAQEKFAGQTAWRPKSMTRRLGVYRIFPVFFFFFGGGSLQMWKGFIRLPRGSLDSYIWIMTDRSVYLLDLSADIFVVVCVCACIQAHKHIPHEYILYTSTHGNTRSSRSIDVCIYM